MNKEDSKPVPLRMNTDQLEYLQQRYDKYIGYCKAGDVGKYGYVSCLQDLAAAIPDLLADINEMRMRLHYVSTMSMTAVQTAWGPLDDLRRRLLWNITDGSRYGEIPQWFRDDPEGEHEST